MNLKTSGPNSKNPGTPFINGVLNIATDDKLMNVIPIHFSYVTAVTSKGRPNETFNILQSIIDGSMGTVMKNGAENAGKLRIDTAIDLNEFYDTRSQGQPLVSIKRNEGGFVHTVVSLNNDEKQRAAFDTDILITGVNRNERPDGTEQMILKGYIFNFRKDILPVDYTVLNPRAMDYFEGLGATPQTPVFTNVKGTQVSQTLVRTVEETSAWGETVIKEIPTSQKAYVVTYAIPEPYMFDDESTILASELTEKMAQREIHLAEIKKNQEEYAAQKNSAFAATPSSDNMEYKF